MGTVENFGKFQCDICHNEKECVCLDDDGPKYENNIVYICKDCLDEAVDQLTESETFE